MEGMIAFFLATCIIWFMNMLFFVNAEVFLQPKFERIVKYTNLACITILAILAIGMIMYSYDHMVLNTSVNNIENTKILEEME